MYTSGNHGHQKNRISAQQATRVDACVFSLGRFIVYQLHESKLLRQVYFQVSPHFALFFDKQFYVMGVLFGDLFALVAMM